MTALPRSLLDALEPIDPRTQIARLAGIDAPCPEGKRESECRHPFCTCFSPDRTADQGDT